MSIWTTIKRWVSNLFKKTDIEHALDITIITPPDLSERQELWRNVMDGTAIWNLKVPSLFTAANLVSRVAKLVMLEFKTEIAGSTTADYLNEQYQRFVKAKPGGLRKAIENGLSGGRYLLFPQIRELDIIITPLENNGYFPTKYNEVGQLIGVVVPLGLYRDDRFYTLLVEMEYDSKPKTYTMRHTAWVSETENTIGKAASLTDVEEWAELPPEIIFSQVEHPWFVEYVSPQNGMAIFDQAIDMFRKLDEQKARTEWEYEGGELAIDASSELFRQTGEMDALNPRKSKLSLELPKGKERLYRTNEAVAGDFAMQTFSPALRGEDLERGSNEIKRDIEDACELARGTISDVNIQAQTATEIEATRQVTFTTIADIQSTTQETLSTLIAIMADMAWRYGLAPKGTHEDTFDWDDSILVDQKEWQEEVKGELHELNTLLNENIVTPAMVLAFARKNLKNFALLTENEIADAAKELPNPLPVEE